MILIVGGASQGKLDFARAELGVHAWSAVSYTHLTLPTILLV